MRILAHYFITHRETSIEELTKVLTNYADEPDIDPDRKAKLSAIILELENPDSELVKYINRQAKLTDTPLDGRSLRISSMEDVCKYRLQLSLIEDKLKIIQSLPAICFSSGTENRPKNKLPRPPKVIKLNGGKK